MTALWADAASIAVSSTPKKSTILQAIFFNVMPFRIAVSGIDPYEKRHK
jgi:hypothetical protein